MYSKFSVIVTSVLIVSPLFQLVPFLPPSPPPPVTPPASLQCCTSVQSSSTSAVSTVAALLGLDLSGLDVPIGLNCSPITVSGNSWLVLLTRAATGGTTVTYDAPEKEWDGLIAINCIPIAL
ncbi:hypothetical protein FB451DRAFT_1516719 [Mycena latifolia]|nr:hypothetical protein FB451DRAFT_1516719 [Mycena latifolia]